MAFAKTPMIHRAAPTLYSCFGYTQADVAILHAIAAREEQLRTRDDVGYTFKPCRAGVARLSFDCGMSERQARTSIGKEVRDGLISEMKYGTNRVSRREISIPRLEHLAECDIHSLIDKRKKKQLLRRKAIPINESTIEQAIEVLSEASMYTGETPIICESDDTYEE